MTSDEADRIWDEYKYRHDHIWRHLVRSTVAVVALITAGYSTSINGNELLFFVAALLAFVYVAFTLWVLIPELRLYTKVKKLHRQRQNEQYKDCPDGVLHKDLEGSFPSRVFVYLAALLVCALAAVVSHVTFG